MKRKMKIAISTESTSDLSKDLLKENNIFVIRYPVLLGENVYSDGDNITPDDIFEFVEETGCLPKTSAINEFTFKDYFKSILDQGYDGGVRVSLCCGGCGWVGGGGWGWVWVRGWGWARR